MSFGHYTAYAKNHLTGKWYDYNDSSVSELDSPEDVISGGAYVLYYKRRDFYPDSNSINYEAIKLVPESEINLDGHHINPVADMVISNNNGHIIQS